MKPGSIIYDLAAEQGGNSAYSEQGKINLIDGVKVIGVKSLMNRLPLTASSLYAKNLFSFIRNLYSRDKKDFNIKDISILKGPCLAKELARKNKTSVVIANKNIKIAKWIGKQISTKYYLTEFSKDVVGVEICSAIKNIYLSLIHI